MNYSNALSNPIFSLISTISSQMALESYVIGGFVRDFLLQKKLPKDIDIVSIGSGISLAEKVAEQLPNSPKVSVFKNFGTAMIKADGLDIEFVGARRESYESNSRKPYVESGTLQDDQNRRDFTINAMAFSLNKDTFGELIDPFDGLGDLERRLIRTPLDPDITYSDDPLRMMRAIRFATQLNFQIEDTSLNAISKNKERLQIISNERIVDELHKILLAAKPSIGLKLLYETGLLHYILPELIALQGVQEQDGQKHKDNFWHTLEVVDNIAEHTDNLWLRWAALLHDIGKVPQVESETPHALLGMEWAEKYGEKPEVCNAIGAHHDEIEMTSLLSPIVQVCDAISGARPGARRQVLDSYIQRLKDLEDAAFTFQGVKKAYAIQAGRELRVIVESEKVTDDKAAELSFNLSQKIQTDMTYPGQVKVTVIRETRAVNIAK